jgi:hypothetical protein
MTSKEAISKYATLVLENKRSVIDLINNLGLDSLQYDSPISEVNKIVIENFGNDDFILGIRKIQSEGYSNVAGVDDIVYIIVFIVVTVATVSAKIISGNRNARMVRQELIREGYRSGYFKKDELQQIAYLERERLQILFLNAQTDYLKRKEEAEQKEKNYKNERMVLIVGVGVLAVIMSTIMIKG